MTKGTKSKSNWMSTVLVAVFSALAGSVGTSYFGVLQQNRSAVEIDFTQLKRTTGEFFQLMDIYSNRARTGSDVDSETSAKFRKAILKLYSDAQNIADRDGRVGPEFRKYSSALTALDEAAKQMRGPKDAKRFVEAASDYYDAETKFTAKVAYLQRSFFRSIF